MFKKNGVFLAAVVLIGFTTGLVNAGLVSSYQFNGNANDSVGSNNGILQNGAYIAQTDRGLALSLDGNNDYMSIAPSSSLNFTGSYTISTWLKAASDPSDDMVWFGYHDSIPNNSIHIRAYRYGLIRYATYGPKVDTAGGVFEFGKWNHVAVTYNAATQYAAVYYNGVLMADGYMPAYAGGSVTATIGKWDVTFQSQNQFEGFIDDCRIYNNALSGAEIAEMVPEPGTIMLLGLGALTLRRLKK